VRRHLWAKFRIRAADARDTADLPPALNVALPAESVARAHAAFENFSLSAPQPTRPVVSRAAGRAGVYAAHRDLMNQALGRLPAHAPPDGGMTLAVSAPDAERLVHSLDSDTATAELADVLAFARRHRSGAEFYVAGNPVVNRLALRRRVRSLITGITRTASSDPAKPPPTQDER
jgi:hypothetical protein